MNRLSDAADADPGGSAHNPGGISVELLPTEGIRLHIVRDAIKRRFVLIVVIAVAFAALAGAYAYSRGKTYTATAQVLLQPIPGNAFSADATANAQSITVAMATEAGLVKSPAVTDLVNRALHTSLPSGLKTVTVTVPSNTETVQIQYKAHSADAAREGAQAFAEAFLTSRNNRATATHDVQLKSLQAQSATVSAQLNAASALAAGADPPPDAAAKVQLYANRLAAIQGSIGDIQATDGNPGSVIRQAEAPGKPAGINPLVYVVAAAIIGLVAGFALAIWRERKDDRIRASAMSEVSGVPFLATLPRERGNKRPLIIQRDAEDALCDGYRRARVGVVAATEAPASLVVTGQAGSTPSGRVAVNLALSLAGAGYEVCVVDASIQGVGVEDLMGIEATPGLSDVLSSGRTIEGVVVRHAGMRIVPRGSDAVAARELYSGSKFAGLVEHLKLISDFVVVAAPPATSADGGGVALTCDAAILVVTDQTTTQTDVTNAVKRMDRLGIRILGAISLPRPERRRQFGRARAATPRQSIAESATEDEADPVDPINEHASAQAIRSRDGD